MQPVGNTNQAIGLQLGWQSLTAAPFTVPAKDPNYTYKQVIILLTDGLNTQDRWYTSAASIDARAAEDLRQHQGRRHHDLHGAGQHRRRPDLDAAAKLRERHQQVLPVDLGDGNRRHLQPDRHRAHYPAAGLLRRSKKSPARAAGLLFAAFCGKENRTLRTPHKNYSAFASLRADGVNQPSA